MNIFLGSIPPAEPLDIIDWCEQNVVMVGSVRGEQFDRLKFPWAVFPIRCMFDSKTRICTFVKPIQSGGSGAGEAVLCGWAKFRRGMIQFNWEKDEKAANKWAERILPILEACRDIDWRGTEQDVTVNKALFRRSFVRNQGVFVSSHLDSDSVPMQINEEIHQWKPGHLAKARGRQTAVWNPKAIDISNAGLVGDQLHEAYLSGTQRQWEVLCPGCGQYHRPRTRWQDKRPDLGGLRYDSEGCIRDDGTIDYLKLLPTIRLQMPCGYEVREDAKIRRQLSLSGRYSEPENPGALGHESLTYEAVSVDFIPFVNLIREKHLSLRALRSGDPEPFRRYIQERECKFYSTDEHPFQGEIVVSEGVTKRREGMLNRVARLWKADWQQGFKAQGELEHFWLVIKDIDRDCNDLLVFEGRINSETDLIATLTEYDAIENGSGVVDCSKNTKHLLEFCYRNKFNAIMSNESFRGSFMHRSDGVRRFYDEGRAICGELNVPPVYEPIINEDGTASPATAEPVIINVNKGGMIANHFFVREHKQRVIENASKEGRIASPIEYIECVIPSDVSDDFRQQYEAWQRVGGDAKTKTDEVRAGTERFQKVRRADHLLICCAGIDMLKDWSGLLGERLEKLGIKNK